MTSNKAGVLFVGPLPPDTVGSAVIDGYLLRALIRRGYAVTALAPMPGEGDEDDCFARENPDIAVHRFTQSTFRLTAYGSGASQKLDDLFALIGEHLPPLLAHVKPRLVIAGNEASAYGATPIVKNYDVPLVSIAHGATNALLAGLYPPALADAVFEALRQADRLVAVAAHLARALERQGCTDVVTIQNGVDLTLFQPGEADPSLRPSLALSDDDVVVLHASNLRGIKGPMDVVASACRTLERDPRLTYLIVGDGPCRKEMESACRNHGIVDRVRFTGWLPHAAMPDYIRLADIVVMPSQMEALPLVHLEAMACARALIASDIPASCELIDNNGTGLLFPLNDVDALTAATLRLAADATLRARLGSHARQMVIGKHDVANMTDAYCALIDSILHDTRPAHAASAGTGRPNC